jgi:hypothetical protein
MIRHVWSVVCSQVFVDSMTNNLAMTAMEIIALEEIAGPPPDGIRVDMEVVTLWVSDAPQEELECYVDIVAPDGRIFSSDARLRVSTGAGARARSRLRLAVIPYAGVGQYLVRVRRVREGDHPIEAVVPVKAHLSPRT